MREVATTLVAPERRSGAYLCDYVGVEIAKWTAVMKASGVTPQQQTTRWRQWLGAEPGSTPACDPF